MDASERALSDLISSLRASDAVVVLGAGLSYDAGMPLVNGLIPLVWHVLDQHESVREQVARDLSAAPVDGKSLIPGFGEAKVAFRRIAENSTACEHFKEAFRSLDESRRSVFSPAHDTIARLLYLGRANLAVSLNWDSLLEAAYAARYKVRINCQARLLEKPHGDVLDLSSPWVLPHEPGKIEGDLVARVARLAQERPRALLIVGYSESDDVVVDRLVAPLSKKWRVFRISPGASGEGAIKLTANEALKKVAAQILPTEEHSGWKFVDFSNQRGLRGAISGTKLGPQDVDACPRMPAVQEALNTLKQLSAVEIAGESGCGKSITAYQVARELHKEGWYVLNMTSSSAPSSVEEIVVPIQELRWRTTLVVDDSQIYPPELVRELTRKANEHLHVVITTTDPRWERRGVIRIAQRTGVESVARAYRGSRDEVLAVVRQFDETVGDQSFSVSLESRLDEAEKSITVWQFNFILRGGWRTAKTHMRTFRDRERADLFLLAVAVYQHMSLDAGVDVSVIAHGVRSLGRDDAWVQRCLTLCQDEQVLLRGELLRFPHLQFADNAIRSFPVSVDDPEATRVLVFIRAAVSNPAASLRGVAWLLRALSGAWTRYGRKVFERETLSVLFERCFHAASARETSDGLQLLSVLAGYMSDEAWRSPERSDQLKFWIENPLPEFASGLANLLNELHNKDKQIGVALMDAVDPDQFARRVAAMGSPDWYSWGYFVSRVAVAAGETWRRRCESVIDVEALRQIIRQSHSHDVDSAVYFAAMGVGSFSRDLALELLRELLPVLGEALQRNPFITLENMRETLWFVIGPPPPGFPYKPSPTQKELAKAIARSISVERLAAEFENSRPYDWERYKLLMSWLLRVSKSVCLRFVRQIDTAKVEPQIRRLWQEPTEDLETLARMLYMADKGKAAHWISSHEDEIENLTPFLACLAPDSAVRIVKRGGLVKARYARRHDFICLHFILDHLAQMEGALAQQVARSNVDEIARWIQDFMIVATDSENEFLGLLQYIHGLSAGILFNIFGLVDIDKVEHAWPSYLSKIEPRRRRSFRKILEFIASVGSDRLCQVAQRILEMRTRRSRRKVVGAS